MPVGPLYNCFDGNQIDKLKETCFDTIYFIGTREEYYDQTNYLPSRDSKGIAACIDDGHKKLYLLLLNDRNQTRNTIFQTRKMTKLWVSVTRKHEKRIIKHFS